MGQQIDVDAAVNAFYDTLRRFTELCPGMLTREGAAGTRLLYTGLPVSTLNCVAVAPDPDLAEVDAFAKEIAAMGVPWSIQTRGEPEAGVRDIAARHGRTNVSTLPLLAADISQPPLTAVPAGATVRGITGQDGAVYAAVLAEGFEMPQEMADVFTEPALLDAPGCTAFVLEVDGEAVAAGFNVVIGEYVALYNGTVPARHRRHGYYRALVAARLRHAVAAGARYGITQNSTMSRPLYESLGFALSEDWRYLSG
ncbi:GNAT family N-acetyltransferase [Kutzneria chonburiensis]|uniref:GNAT family N-acetyltransferase n=1 Tax=Kutzneria chonburiensis TaxID=1483604 RepID=A0ABV6N0N4_9PSEU|nr:GNAT family N-acetyltransferase [Kutzneria chonburiensis]